MKTFAIAGDLLREAASRKWFLALGLGITALLFTLGLSLQVEVVDGALAATRLFGNVLSTDIQSADVAMRPVFIAVSYVVFYGGAVFGILSCADFAPSLLSPGRIEHLLSLPVRRWELLLGTFGGVLAIALVGALYGAGGMALILGVKTHVWTWRPIAAAVLAGVAFSAVYSVMLTVSLFVRSAAVSAGAGFALFVFGIVAGFRDKLIPMFQAGFGRSAFATATLFVPRISALANAAAQIAGSKAVDPRSLGMMMLGFVVFGASALAVGGWQFDRRDF